MNSATSKDKGIFWYFFIFFMVVAAVNLCMVTLAIKTSTGLVTDHAYEKGIAYNKVVEAEEEQEKLGWKAEMEVKNDILYITLRDKSGKLLIPDKIVAHFFRPTQQGLDFEVKLTGGKAKVDFPMPGIWEIRVFASIGKNSYQQSKRMVIE